MMLLNVPDENISSLWAKVIVCLALICNSNTEPGAWENTCLLFN